MCLFPPQPADLQTRERDLQRREEELEAKAIKLKKMEDELRRAGALVKKNWPVCYPMTYHNIEEMVPESKQRMVRLAYRCYLVSVPSLGPWMLPCAQLWHVSTSGRVEFQPLKDVKFSCSGCSAAPVNVLTLPSTCTLSASCHHLHQALPAVCTQHWIE